MAKSRTQIDWQEYKEKILASLDLRQEFCNLGLDITGREAGRDGWLECRAFDREDNTPSAAVNVKSGWYKDLGGTGQSLSFWDLSVALKKFPNWKTARDHYAAKTNFRLDGRFRDPAEHLAFMPWNEPLVKLWCRHKPGVTLESIAASGGRLARYRDQYTVVALPIYGPALTASEPIGWVLWNINGKELPIFHGKDKTTGESKISWKKMKTTGGSEAGLIGKHALEQLQKNDPGRQLIWKVEGPTDLLALWAIIPPEKRDRHLVITNAGGSNQHPLPWMDQIFAGRHVAVIHDADQPGQAGAERWAAWSAKIAADVWPVKLPYEISQDHGQDLRDWIAEPHDYSDLLALLDAIEPYVVGLREPYTQKTTSGVIEADDDPFRLARMNLEKYATRHDGRTLRYWRDEWYTWKRTQYQKINERELRAKVAMSIKEEFDRINLLKQETASDGDLPTAHKVTQAVVSNTMQAMGGMSVLSATIEPGTWIPTKQQRHYISMANGILDIDALLRDADESECLIQNSPQWFSMVSLPYEFDAGADCPKWDAFLDHNLEGDTERIKVLQEWAGYLLLPDTGEQKFMMLEGEGANGKSVYIAGLTAMLGEDNVSTVPLEIFGERFSRTETLGKLLNAAGDCGEIDKVAEGYIKSFSSGDRMFFDRKGVSGINCRPTARLMIACNSRPRVIDRSQGVWRRSLLIPWKVQITKEKRVRGMDKVDWWQDSEELPGIFNWALRGLFRLRSQNGFSDCQAMREALQDYQDEMNPAGMFIQEHLEQKRGSRIRSKNLYGLYSKWARESGYHPLSDKNFGRELKRAFRVERGRNGTRVDRCWYYDGIGFTVDEICGTKTEEAILF